MVEGTIHRRINTLWEKFSKARPRPTAEEVQRAGDVIDDPFKPWYHQAGNGLTSRTPEEAERAALDALKRLFPGLE
jgi:hypothetical protein